MPLYALKMQSAPDEKYPGHASDDTHQEKGKDRERVNTMGWNNFHLSKIFDVTLIGQLWLTLKEQMILKFEQSFIICINLKKKIINLLLYLFVIKYE